MDVLIPSPLTDTTPLSAADRCDACSAQALVRAVLPSRAALLFCGHHAGSHRPALLAAGAVLHDETSRLAPRRESSAAA